MVRRRSLELGRIGGGCVLYLSLVARFDFSRFVLLRRPRRPPQRRSSAVRAGLFSLCPAVEASRGGGETAVEDGAWTGWGAWASLLTCSWMVDSTEVEVAYGRREVAAALRHRMRIWVAAAPA